MKDFLGHDISVNDLIVFVNHQGNYLQRGEIKKILKTKLIVSFNDFPKSTTSVFPEHCVKI